MADFANVWQAADKIVYSTTLHAVSTANTRLERRFDPDSIRDMKTSAASDLTVAGPTLAAHAFNAGLVDERQLFVHPVLVGEGKPAFPSDARIELELLEQSRFGNGVVTSATASRTDPPVASAPVAFASTSTDVTRVDHQFSHRDPPGAMEGLSDDPCRCFAAVRT